MSTTRRVVRRKECNVIVSGHGIGHHPHQGSARPGGGIRIKEVVGGPDDATRTLDLTGDGQRARILVAVTGPGLGFAASAG